MFAMVDILWFVAGGAVIWFFREPVTVWYKGAEDYIGTLHDKIKAVAAAAEKAEK
jgi:hypothetical protein